MIIKLLTQLAELIEDALLSMATSDSSIRFKYMAAAIAWRWTYTVQFNLGQLAHIVKFTGY